jgi:hypothetical protein
LVSLAVTDVGKQSCKQRSDVHVGEDVYALVIRCSLYSF